MINKILLTSLFLFISITHAAINLPAIFSDNMVLQANTNAAIWGKAEPNSTVSLKCSWDKKTTQANADAQGKWNAKIKTPKKGDKLSIAITIGSETKTINNILIGDVWLCTGQSNMELKVKEANDANDELPKANIPSIRLFLVERATSETPLDDCKGQWLECTTATAAQFSAIGYYFGKEINEKTKTPIGLIDSSAGGSTVQAWMSRETLASDAELKWFLDNDANNQAHKEFYEKQYAPAYRKWQQDVIQALKEHKPKPRQPILPNAIRVRYRPCLVYNTMINPLIPFNIKGVIWYQGESNRGTSHLYGKLFQTMIKSWRSQWQQEFPFYYVQLPAYGKIDPKNAGWVLIRQAQLETLNLPKTGMAVTMDVGEANDIHPKNKKPVGHRLALWALAKDYGFKNITYSGPLYKAMKIEGDKIRISFDYARAGLKTPNNEPLAGFTIAGEDMNFIEAKADIQGSEVVVWSDKIKNPQAVRYGWADWIKCNLYNTEGLPASPFRTDYTMDNLYVVKKTSAPNLKQLNWENANTIKLSNFMGDKPEHFPNVRAQLLYDDKNIYVFFKVEDQYVRAVAQKNQDSVCRDSCVEFFFTPSENIAEGYFNLEMNCGGTMLLYHQTARDENRKEFSQEDCEKIQITTSMPKIVEPEISEPTTWILKSAVPFELIKKYAKVEQPKAGVKWRANFYKCADQTSHPHWLTWAKVNLPKPDFHRPEFFGTLVFE